MKKILYSIITIASITWSSLSAQEGTTLNFMTLLPQYNKSNIAKETDCNVYFSFPALSMVNVRFDNNSLSIDRVMYRKDTLAHLNFDNYVKEMPNKNNIGVNFHWDVLSFGFRLNKGFLHFSTFTHVDGGFVLPKETMEFMFLGPGTITNRETLLKGNNIYFNAYAGVSLGYSYQINEKLNVGLNLKYLKGIANVYTEKGDFTYFSDADADVPYSTTITSDISIKASMPGDSINLDSLTTTMPYDDWDFYKAALNKNNGFAIDFGATYQLTKKLTLGFSVIDLGFIHWDNSVNTITSKSSFSFTGVDIIDIFHDGEMDSTVFTNLIDTLKTALDFQQVQGGSYNSRLRTKFTVSAEYRLTKNDLFGAIFKGDFNYDQFTPSLSIGYQHTFFGRLGIAVNNTIIGRDFFNFGAGLTLGAGPVQLYLIVDQINSFYFESMRSVNVQFGFNFVLGTNPKYAKKSESVENDY